MIPARPLPARWASRLSFGVRALVVVTILAATGLLVASAQEHRRVAPQHRVELGVWHVARRPSWATLDDVREVRAASGLRERAMPLFDRGAAAEVRAQLESAARVERVVAMRRRPPDRLVVTVELRRPVAALRTADGRFLEVDAAGIVLGAPLDARPVRDGLPLRVVSGAADTDLAPGTICGPDAAGGIALCRALDAALEGRGEHVLRTFDEVDVANFGGRAAPAESPVLLRSAEIARGRRRTACVVEWGRLDERHGEPSLERKVAQLAEAVRLFGEFDGVARVRVAYEDLSVLPVHGAEGAWLPALADRAHAR